MITNSSTSKKQSWTSLQCILLVQNNQNVQVMPHSTCLPAFCEKTAEPVWLPRKLKLGLGQMFLNGNIYHTFQNNKLFPNTSFFRKESCLIFLSLLSFLNKKYFSGRQYVLKGLQAVAVFYLIRVTEQNRGEKWRHIY